ncbi:hypothetical protein KZZ52_41675 [Dactylosporangium sp. AC04546]|uniref:hypothetical protein n=1 Tax=Dactylosporangium sp. AC04546 TaxID=2862460 RepID=UPI002E7AFC02|nr:hypothetical protein [Dactylosporangium sp. AC04546]WVK80436.1 hypothetical protein KZZ52_41675 [Dactylosporangium sp. AC04546]
MVVYKDRTSPSSAPVIGQFTWPTHLTWVTVAGLDLPVAPVAGPHDLANGRARGFRQTPPGAVLAALHILVRTSPHVGPSVWEPTLEEQVVGPDAVEFGEVVRLGYELARDEQQLPDGAALGPIPATILGVRIDAYSTRAVSLRMLIETDRAGGTPAWVAMLVQLSWSDGDWRMIAPPGGDWAAVEVPASTFVLGDYVPLPRRS